MQEHGLLVSIRDASALRESEELIATDAKRLTILICHRACALEASSAFVFLGMGSFLAVRRNNLTQWRICSYVDPFVSEATAYPQTNLLRH